MQQACLIWKQERENYNTEKTHDKTVGPQVQKLKEIRPFPKCMMEEKRKLRKGTTRKKAVVSVGQVRFNI